MVKLLIADDNKQITEVLANFAKKEKMDVDIAYDGKEAWDLFQTNEYDILLLDVMMPEIDGFTLCKKIRAESMVPIILITAKGEDYERIMGLDLGADDYIVKPFSLAEVMARIRAILRRVEVNPQEDNKIQLEDLTLDMDSYEAFVDKEEMHLTKKEFEILWTLASHKGKVFQRENLLDSLWGYDYYGDARTVDTHIKRIRAKIPKNKELKWKIETIRGLGYKFDYWGQEE